VTKPQSFQVNVRIAASNMTLSQSFQPSEAWNSYKYYLKTHFPLHRKHTASPLQRLIG
jgi:hypothetical protein